MTTIKYHTKEEAIQAVTKDGTELQYCSTKLKNDEELVMVAIKQYGWTFGYASKELRSNKAFIMKALHDDIEPCSLIRNSNIIIRSEIEAITLAVEKNNDGWVFLHAQGEAALNKELTAKALVKSGNHFGNDYFGLWVSLHPTMKEFFPKESFYEKAQSYLYQLEQEKQAELVSGGSTAEDEVVW